MGALLDSGIFLQAAGTHFASFGIYGPCQLYHNSCLTNNKMLLDFKDIKIFNMYFMINEILIITVMVMTTKNTRIFPYSTISIHGKDNPLL